jgi:hypothetical protein
MTQCRSLSYRLSTTYHQLLIHVLIMPSVILFHERGYRSMLLQGVINLIR